MKKLRLGLTELRNIINEVEEINTHPKTDGSMTYGYANGIVLEVTI